MRIFDSFTARPPRGAGLLIAMVIILLLASMTTVLLNEMQTKSTQVEVDLEDIKAFEAAEAGLDVAIAHINNSPLVEMPGVFTPLSGKPVYVHDRNVRPGCVGTENWTIADDVMPFGARPSNYIPRPNWQNVEVNGRIHEDNIVPQQLGDVAFFTYAIDWLYDGIDNDNDGLVDNVTERNKFTIYSTGINRGLVRNGATEEGKVVTVEAVAEAKDADAPPFPSGVIEFQFDKKAP